LQTVVSNTVVSNTVVLNIVVLNIVVLLKIRGIMPKIKGWVPG